MGYFQILIRKENKDKTASYTDHDIFCNQKISFGLKNARATYQGLVDSIFSKQIGQNIEVYVDDMDIKSLNKATLVKDIEETFKIL